MLGGLFLGLLVILVLVVVDLRSGAIPIYEEKIFRKQDHQQVLMEGKCNMTTLVTQ